MARSFDTWVYVTDAGTEYNRKVADDIATQLGALDAPKIGSAAATEVHPSLPRSFKPRVALAQDASKRRYRIIAMASDALILTPGATLNLFDRDGGEAIAVTVYGSEGERSRNKLLTPG